MPHIDIKHFPKKLTAEQRDHLADAITALVVEHFDTDSSAVSVTLEPITKDAWHERVVVPDIKRRTHLLIKRPGYPLS
ncbi:tautomerase PptA [Streptomyces sp. NPDC048445]|uniref:tautomerase PptA n=1 Tax=Streptomyces sp. NPDC048445 TaxID=3365553 RepID=UPI0037102A90